MPCGTATATGPPSRTASAELARTAPPAVAPRHWCGDAGASAALKRSPQSSQRCSAKLSLVLFSGELGGRSAERRCCLPSVRCLRPPLPGPAPLALVPRGRVSTEVGRPRQQKQRVSANPPQRRKNWEESTKTRCRRCRSPCVLASPAAPPGRACSPCGDVAAAGIRRSRPWQPQKRIRRNGAYVYPVVPEAFRRELAKGFHAAIVAKALREHGHLNGELGRLAYLERLPGLGHQRVYRIRSSIFAEYWWVQRVSRVQPR